MKYNVLWLLWFVPFSYSLTSDNSLELKGIDFQLAGDYEAAKRVEQQLLLVKGSPIGHVFALNSITTQMTWNEANTAYHDDLRYHATEILKWCKANLKGKGDQALTHFYCGQTNFALSYYFGLNGNFYKAGKHGVVGIDQMETALKLDPQLHDAKFHLGLAYYVADNLPPFIKAVSSLLWFIPTGNSEKSISYLKESIIKGERYKDVARYTLGSLFLENELTYSEAEDHFRYLSDKFSKNPRFHLQLIFVLLIQEKFEESIFAAKGFLKNADSNSAEYNLAKVSMIRAQLRNRELVEAQRNFSQIEPYFSSEDSNLPGWSIAWFKLTSAQLNDILSHRRQAISEYKEIIEISKSTYVFEEIKLAAKAGLKEPYKNFP